MLFSHNSKKLHEFNRNVEYCFVVTLSHSSKKACCCPHFFHSCFLPLISSAMIFSKNFILASSSPSFHICGVDMGNNDFFQKIRDRDDFSIKAHGFVFPGAINSYLALNFKSTKFCKGVCGLKYFCGPVLGNIKGDSHPRGRSFLGFHRGGNFFPAPPRLFPQRLFPVPTSKLGRPAAHFLFSFAPGKTQTQQTAFAFLPGAIQPHSFHSLFRWRNPNFPGKEFLEKPNQPHAGIFDS